MAVGLRYQREGGTDPGFIFGSAATCWVVWVVSTAPGFWLGASVDPNRFGLDMVMPAFFTAMMVSLCRDRAARSAGSLPAARPIATDQIWAASGMSSPARWPAASWAGWPMNEPDPLGFAMAIVAMAVAGRPPHSRRRFLAHRPFTIGPRLRQMFDALPAPFIAATIAPLLVRGGVSAVARSSPPSYHMHRVRPTSPRWSRVCWYGAPRRARGRHLPRYASLTA